MHVSHSLIVEGGSRPSLGDLGRAVELLKANGAPDDRPVKVAQTSGGPWSVSVTWIPDPEPEPGPEPGLEPGEFDAYEAARAIQDAAKPGVRRVRDAPQA